MSDMNDTIIGRTGSFRDYIVQRRATADDAADPAVCAFAALAMSGIMPARLPWGVLKATSKPKHLSTCRPRSRCGRTSCARPSPYTTATTPIRACASLLASGSTTKTVPIA